MWHHEWQWRSRQGHVSVWERIAHIPLTLLCTRGTNQWRQLLWNPPLHQSIVATAVDEAHCVSKWKVCEWSKIEHKHEEYPCVLWRSQAFRSSYGRLREIRALVPSTSPVIALTATVTKSIREDVLCILVLASECISTLVKYLLWRTYTKQWVIRDWYGTSCGDFEKNAKRVECVIVYYCTVNLCVTLYEHLHMSLGENSYFSPGAPNVNINRLFGMFHSQTLHHHLHQMQHVPMTDCGHIICSCGCGTRITDLIGSRQLMKLW